MPTLKDIEVHVTDKEGKPLEEYGVQKLTTIDLTSCFIESKSDKPFRISVKPVSMPFPAFSGLDSGSSAGSPAACCEGAREEDFKYSYHRGFDELRRAVYPDAAFNPADEAPYHLLATMRLDGRRKFEKQIIVYLDQKHPSYASDTQGEVVFKHRLMYDDEGKIRSIGWVFKDVGVEDVFSDLFSMMGIGGENDGQGAVPVTAEDELAEAFLKLGEHKLEDKQESQAGQIEITLERIKVKETQRGAWQGARGASRDERGAKANLKDITHTVGRQDGGQHVGSVDAIIYEPWENKAEKHYATFLFYYRSAKTLGRFGFPGFATGADAPSATEKGELAASKLASSSVLGQKVRRGREEVEDEETPMKAGRWEFNVAVRGNLGGAVQPVVKKEDESKEGEDEEL